MPVVIGAQNLKFPLSSTISPGSLPRPSLENQGQSNPVTHKMTPRIIIVLDMVSLWMVFEKVYARKATHPLVPYGPLGL
jgi:hypothetical protein